MKSGVAAMLVAARALSEMRQQLRGDLILAMTAGEEVGMTGAQQVAAWPELGDVAAIIISEPTDNTVGLAERGVLWIELTTHGQTAHGSTPHLGRNAINMMRRLLDAVDRVRIPFARHPILGDFTYSLDTIQGGTVNNVVPDRCVASLDLRTVPGQDHNSILRHFEALIGELTESEPEFSAEVHSPFSLPAIETPADHPAVADFTEAVAAATGRPAAGGIVRFATEAAIFVPALQLPVIVYGPGDPDLAHQPDENVAIGKMLEAARVYTAAALHMLGAYDPAVGPERATTQ
jgi:succinyl-diaminopimelate desuccinylase